MKTLVIGGTGLLGIALIKELLSRNKEVKTTVRNNAAPEALKLLRQLDVEITYADIRDKESIEKALEHIQDVYLVAALFKTWVSDLKEFEQTNVQGTRNVLESCFKKGIRRVVYTSSHGIIGLVDYPGYANETTPVLNHQLDNSLYLRSKYQAEQIVQELCKMGLDIITVNPAGIIGINDYSNNPTNKYIHQAAVGHIPRFCVDAYACLVDSRDVAKGHVLAMERGKRGERYILGGENITFKEYFSHLVQLAKSDKNLINIPLPCLLILSYVLEWKARLTCSAPALTVASVRFLMKRTRYSSKKAQDELGYQFRPIKESIKEVFSWFKEQSSRA